MPAINKYGLPMYDLKKVAGITKRIPKGTYVTIAYDNDSGYVFVTDEEYLEYPQTIVCRTKVRMSMQEIADEVHIASRYVVSRRLKVKGK